jgi:hypothetical protein
MKSIFILAMLLFVIACNGPANVTSNPDDHSATSGTLGSAKSENDLPNETKDTTNRIDSITHK